MTAPYYFGTALMKLLLLLFTRWQVKGGEHVPRQGPLIVVANHLSLADPPLLSASIPRRIVFMAKEEAFRSPILGPLVRAWRAFPVQRERLDREALREAKHVLGQGLVLGMFPEGRRSVTTEMQQAYPGTALVAIRNGAPILPVGIAGSENLSPLGLLRRPEVVVRIGQPLRLSPPDGKLTQRQLAVATDTIMARIAELLPQSYRGNYGGKERAVADR